VVGEKLAIDQFQKMYAVDPGKTEFEGDIEKLVFTGFAICGFILDTSLISYNNTTFVENRTFLTVKRQLGS